ncbi:DUF2804 domain-containing protein [Filobacillus milosensis]|uniref:DUF2804 domain-containing protein n=1 Tax=Filobacillus milosensis TaxID=94137 RepID=A0A4Y8IQ67_9BACI|nr:DUF2804 domain-containing protein [Filobacillus milosensis]TFB22816.1 DUF2804 domain-containing protein [Filobacillus milosensis]
MRGKEITRPVKLCHDDGTLNHESVGWSRHPMILCNVNGSYLRKKKWNYWCITGPEAVFSITVSHFDYAAVIFAYILDLQTFDFVEKSIIVPFGKGVVLPDNVQDSISLQHKGLRVEIEENNHASNFYVLWPNFKNNKPLEVDLSIHRSPTHESLNVVIPWSNERYQFTSKQIALPVQGEIAWVEGIYKLQTRHSFATLDFGRGKWPYQSKWNWGAASGFAEGYRIGLNLGGQWTSGTGQTENGIIIDHQLHKIHDEIEWLYNRRDYTKPWVIHTPNDKQIKLMFEPIFERVSAFNLGVVKSMVHQLFGYYSGTVETTDGESIQIDQLFGWAEDHEARW